jgi:hypothetical protein
MTDFYTTKRTQTVLSVLVRIESFVLCLARVALAKRSSQSLDSMLNEARKIVAFDQELGSMGVGLSRCPFPDPKADLITFLRCVKQIVHDLEAFGGSSQGLTESGSHLVENHFSLLEKLNQSVDFAISNPPDSAGLFARLLKSTAELEAQIAELKPLSLNGENVSWSSAS